MLQAETGRFWGKRVLRGIQRADTLVLRLRHLFLHNSFETVAAVKVLPGLRGSQLEVTLRSNYLVAGFMTFWLGLVILIGAAVVVNAVGSPAASGAVATSVILPIFGFGFIAVGRLIAHSDGRELLDFIRETTRAEDLPPGLGSSIPTF